MLLIMPKARPVTSTHCWQFDVLISVPVVYLAYWNILKKFILPVCQEFERYPTCVVRFFVIQYLFEAQICLKFDR